MMGRSHSKYFLMNKIGISGNHNLAFMVNGVNYNISSIFDETINQIVEGYRSDLILVHFTSVSLMLILISVIIRCLISDCAVAKREIN